MQVHIYFYILHKYCHTHEGGGVLEYQSYDSVRNITPRKSKKRFLENVPAQSFPLFFYTDSIESQIKNHPCAPNVL